MGYALTAYQLIPQCFTTLYPPDVQNSVICFRAVTVYEAEYTISFTSGNKGVNSSREN